MSRIPETRVTYTLRPGALDEHGKRRCYILQDLSPIEQCESAGHARARIKKLLKNPHDDSELTPDEIREMEWDVPE